MSMRWVLGECRKRGVSWCRGGVVTWCRGGVVSSLPASGQSRRGRLESGRLSTDIRVLLWDNLRNLCNLRATKRRKRNVESEYLRNLRATKRRKRIVEPEYLRYLRAILFKSNSEWT